MSKITVNVNTVRGLILASAKKDARYYLCGTLFDFKYGRAVSTDGHCLLAVNTDMADGYDHESVIVPREALETIAKGGSVTDEIDVTYDGETVTLTRAGGLSISTRPIDGTFPQYERVMPDTVSGELAQFDPELLARIAKALNLATGRKEIATVGHNGASGAVVFIDGDASAIGVCMPCRIGGDAAQTMAEFLNNGNRIQKVA